MDGLKVSTITNNHGETYVKTSDVAYFLRMQADIEVFSATKRTLCGMADQFKGL